MGSTMRLSLRMEQDAALTRQSELEERLRKTEAQLDALVQWKGFPKAWGGVGGVVLKLGVWGTGHEAKATRGDSVRYTKTPGSKEEKAESPYRQQGETALQVASELMRRLSAEENGSGGQERMDALIAESHQTSSGPGPTKRSPHALDPAGPKKVPERHTSPELLALPAPPTPKVRNGRRRPQFASASAAHTVAKAAQAEAEARQTRIRQLQQELVRQREALASKRRAPEDSGMAPESRPTEGEDRRRSALQLPQEERQMGEAEIHGEQALLFPRPKRRAREERLHEFLQAEVVFFASREPMLGKSITLRQILDAKTPEQAANLAYRELPIRYAQRILQIEALPEWQASRELVEVHRLYSENFKDIRLVELDVKELEPFTEVIETIKGRMKEVIPMLATAMRNLQWADGYSEAAIVQWLDAFFLSRIGTEMLTSQYMASAKPDAVALRRRRVGVVDFACDPVNICEQAARHARKLVKQHYDESADVEIVVESGVGGKSSFEIESRIRFPYVPNYLFYIMVELLKNSARATVEAQQENPGQRRPIVITVGADRREVAIRVWDQAGGIPFHAAEKVWSYMYSTASKAAREFDEQGTPLAGYGVGLPLSRLYARYLGGALYLQSMPGVGTCAYLYLKRLESEAREELPERSSVSSCSLV
ncbi:unnamed protein product [Durusdinium trenchii]|uniref:Protein-serine/threonine kinase n=1 Tax=Durusdinium trenchii TaxID=1381693 RepID=A0ABP0PRG5_9DINO